MLRISFSFIFSIFIDCTGVNPMDEEMCLVDSGTVITLTFTSHKNPNYKIFSELPHD